MREDWKAFLTDAGANIEGDTTLNFGNSDREQRVAIHGGVISDLSHYGLIAAYGPDAKQFLQNQLTNDINLVSESQSQLNGYCNPKGRLFTLFQVFMRDETYYLQLPRELVEALLKRLRMFVLNAKVTLEDASDSLVRIAYAGTNTETEFKLAFTHYPDKDYESLNHDGITLIKLPSPTMDRYEIIGEPDAIKKIWGQLDVNAAPVGAPAWQLLEIISGQPSITSKTSEVFVPQMLNLDTLDGISFKKGCYPGQEIVARVRYLGKIKRRMFLAFVDSNTLPEAGATLYRNDNDNDKINATGTVVSAAPGPDGGFYILCTLETAHRDTPVYLGQSLDFPIKLMDLPYQVEI